MSAEQRVLEHRTSRSGRWLADRRLKIAFGIAITEGILLAFGVFSWWIGVVIAGAAIGYYIWRGRSLKSHAGRQVSWIAAASQTMVVLVPIVRAIVGTLALIVVGLLAVVALVFLVTDRR